jgi:hypothetical protein
VFWVGFCTFSASSRSTLIGAAHCINRNGQQVSFKARNGKTYRANCDKHPLYRENDPSTNNDFALCKLTEELPEGHAVSIISTEIMEPGQKVLVAGYGKPNVGVLHLGESVIRNVTSQDYITRTPVALGSGDSAGPIMKGPIADLEKGPFIQIGVNSRRSTTDTTSYYNITGLERSLSWFRQWATQNNVTLCGVNSSCDTAKPIPENCKGDVEVLAYFKAEVVMAEKALEVCLRQ